MLGIIYPFRTKEKLTLETVFINSAYAISMLLPILFIFSLFFPLKYLLNPTFYFTIFVFSIFETIKTRPKITLYSLLGISLYFLMTAFIFQIDVLFKTKISFGWNEDFFFHERIIRIINNYGQFFKGTYPQGYIDTVGKMLTRIHYPIGSHIISNLFNNFDTIFHNVIAAASNIKILYSYSMLIFIFLMKKNKSTSWFIFFIAFGIYLFPLMQSMVANDFIGQYPSFFLITLLTWQFLKNTFDFNFIFILFSLLITYYFMIIPFIPAFIILGIFLIMKKKFTYLSFLAIIVLYMFYYYLPLATHIENDIVPGGLINKFSWLEVAGVKLIYSGITSYNRLRYIFIPSLIVLLVFMVISECYKYLIQKDIFKKIKNNPYSLTFIPAISLILISYYFLKPYLFYKLLPTVYIIGGFLIIFRFSKLSSILKILFIGVWVSVMVLNIYHTRLYYYNPTRSSNSQFPNTESFNIVDKLINNRSVIINDNIYFNNLLSLKHNDTNIYTNSAYSDFLPELLVNYVNKDSEFYLPNYKTDKFDQIFISKDLNFSTPPLSSFLFNYSTKLNFSIYSKNKINFKTVYENNKPLLIKNFDEFKNKISLTNKKQIVMVWQNKDRIVDVTVSAKNIENYLSNKYPFFLYSLHYVNNENTLVERNIILNDYFNNMQQVLIGDNEMTEYKVDVGLYTDSFFINNFQEIRFWESQRGWSKLITPEANIIIPLITNPPRVVNISIGSETQQKIKIINNNCQLETKDVQIVDKNFREIVLNIPENCYKDQYEFKIIGHDLGRNSLIVDRFSVKF